MGKLTDNQKEKIESLIDRVIDATNKNHDELNKLCCGLDGWTELKCITFAEIIGIIENG